MPRPVYKITDEDYRNAIDYLLAKHKHSGNYHSLTRCLNAEELQNWCDLNINKDEFRTLRVSLRAKRKRSKDSQAKRKQKQITISPNAWKCLKSLAEEDGISFSKVLDIYLGALKDCSPIARKRFLETGNL